MELTSLLSALMPTTSSLLFPVPALKFASVIWFEDDAEPDVDWILFNAIPVGGGVTLCVVADAVFEGELLPTELIADILYV